MRPRGRLRETLERVKAWLGGPQRGSRSDAKPTRPLCDGRERHGEDYEENRGSDVPVRKLFDCVCTALWLLMTDQAIESSVRLRAASVVFCALVHGVEPGSGTGGRSAPGDVGGACEGRQGAGGPADQAERREDGGRQDGTGSPRAASAPAWAGPCAATARAPDALATA